MKKVKFMTMVMVAALAAGTSMTFASCKDVAGLNNSLTADKADDVVTEGTIVKQKRKVGKFIFVKVEGSPTVKFVQGSKHEVIVQGTKDYVDKVKTVVDGNKLVVGLKSSISLNIFKNRKERKNFVIYVTSPDLVGVELAGSGDFICQGPIDTDRLDVQVAGSGEVDFNGRVICDNLNVQVSGSGDAEMADVETIATNLQLVGSGDIKVNQKNVEHTKIQLIGSGDIKVGLDKCRDVESSLAGSGDITLKGNITGRLNKAKAGSGDYIIELRK